MSDSNDVNLPIGVPFIGGSDDPFDLVGISDGKEYGETSEEGGDPGV